MPRNPARPSHFFRFLMAGLGLRPVVRSGRGGRRAKAKSPPTLPRRPGGRWSFPPRRELPPEGGRRSGPPEGRRGGGRRRGPSSGDARGRAPAPAGFPREPSSPTVEWHREARRLPRWRQREAPVRRPPRPP